jgi:hypothetical protein
MSHDRSKIPRDRTVISSYALWTCIGSTQLANYHQVLLAWYSGLYCPSNHSDINANENHIKHLSKQYVLLKFEEVQQQVETEWKTWSLWLFQSLTT